MGPPWQSGSSSSSSASSSSRSTSPSTASSGRSSTKPRLPQVLEDASLSTASRRSQLPLLPLLGNLRLHSLYNQYVKLPVARTLRWSQRRGDWKRDARATVLDVNSDVCVMSSDMAKNCRQPIEEKEERMVQMGPHAVAVRRWTTVAVEVLGRQMYVPFAVVDKLASVDMVLGANWLKRNHLRVDWNRRRVLMGDMEQSLKVSACVWSTDEYVEQALFCPKLADVDFDAERTTHSGGEKWKPAEPLWQKRKRGMGFEDVRLRKRRSRGGGADEAQDEMAVKLEEVKLEIDDRRLKNSSAKKSSCYVDPYDENADPSYGTGFPRADNPYGLREDLLHVAPGLSRRCGFVLQDHRATARHADLRLSCDIPGAKDPHGTLSWAIPRGLSKFRRHKYHLAIRTPRHRIDYAEYEGGPNKPTMVIDAGYYRILSSARTVAKGLDEAEPTDEDSEWVDEEVEEAWDQHQMRQLRKKVDKGAFIIELYGTRFTMRLLFVRVGVKFPRRKVYLKNGKRQQTDITVPHQEWLIRKIGTATDPNDYLDTEDQSLDDMSLKSNLTPDVGERSILCGKTIYEVQQWARTEEGKRLHRAWLRKHAKWFGRDDKDDEGYLTDDPDYNVAMAEEPDAETKLKYESKHARHERDFRSTKAPKKGPRKAVKVIKK